MFLQEPRPVSPLTRKGGAYPIGQRCRYNPDGLGGLGFFTDHDESLSTSPLLRRSESLHFVNRHRIQIQVVDERGSISGLLANDLCAGVFQNAEPMNSGLEFRAHKVFDCLTDPPDAGITLASDAVQLHDF